MTTLVLVRHGQSEANNLGVFAGHFDAELTPLGFAQAERTARYIADNYRPCKVYASDLKRAYKTGKCVADLLNIDIIADKSLREIRAGKWEACEFDKLQTDYAEDYKTWLSDIGNARCTDGESVAELAERVMNELEAIAKANDGTTVVIATHATPIRAAQCLVQSGSLDDMKNIHWVSNASVSVLTYSGRKWKFVEVSRDEHLGELKSALPSNV